MIFSNRKAQTGQVAVFLCLMIFPDYKKGAAGGLPGSGLQ
jgi:hypothetical protein